MIGTSRAYLSTVAQENGWGVYDNYPVPTSAHGGGEWVAYFRAAEQVLIVWTRDDTATYVAKISGTDGPDVAIGMNHMNIARGWLESAPAKQLAFQR
jgi:hypothetical protein